MCQPGLPGPQGDSQEGSPGLADFQSAKSRGFFFAQDPLPRARLLPVPRCSCPRACRIPENCARKNGYRPPVRRRGCLRSIFAPKGNDFRNMPGSPRGATSAGRLPKATASARNARVNSSATSEAFPPFLIRPVDDLIVNVRNVLHEGNLESAALQDPAQGVEHHERARIAHVKMTSARRPAGVDAYFPRA